MTPDEAVTALNALDGGDNEVIHSRADDILLAVVPVEVSEAWYEAAERCGGFWYA